MGCSRTRRPKGRNYLIQCLGLKSLTCLAVLICFLGLSSAAGAQEFDCSPLRQELTKAGFEILDLGEAYGVPYVEIKVPVGASVTTICRRVPSLSVDVLDYRDKIAFFNGVHPLYVRTIEPQPFSLEAATLKIPLNLDQAPEIFPAYKDTLASFDKFILVDLDKGFLALYARGELERVFPVSGGTSGRETPLIDFEIQAKEKNHWSTIYDVWMPWSLLIKAPYYIHGGVLPGEHDSAGCIRMFRQDARELYHLVDVGTPGRIVQPSRIEPSSPQDSFAQLSASRALP
jgi:hypothetical protein